MWPEQHKLQALAGQKRKTKKKGTWPKKKKKKQEDYVTSKLL